MKELKQSQRLIITSAVIIQDKHGLTKAVLELVCGQNTLMT